VKHHQFGTWSVSNDELALVRSDFEQLCTHLTATADRGDVELNGPDFADIPDKTYLKRIEGAHRIASPRLRNDHEVGEAMQSTRIRFYATYSNQMGECYDEQNVFWSRNDSSLSSLFNCHAARHH
jgi:hypothetical protein